MVTGSAGRARGCARPRAALAGLVLLSGGFCYGFLAHRNELFPYRWLSSVYRRFQPAAPQGRPGRWLRAQTPGLTPQQRERLSNLKALGYVSGQRAAPARTGVIAHRPDQAYAGYNYYTSGHAPEAILMDMKGRVLHTWRREFRDVWPRRDTSRGRTDYWRRAYLYPNGDLLAIYDGLGLVKLDKDSRVLWGYDGACHHDLDVVGDGKIYVLTWEAMSHPQIRSGEPVWEDFVTVLGADGRVLRKVSILAAFMASPYASVLARIPAREDIFHTNTIKVLDGRLQSRSPAFRASNVLISVRNVDVIAVLDLDAERIVWAMAGMWRMQHQSTILDTGNILLFDNQGGHNGFSKVIEFDPFAAKPVKADPFVEFEPQDQRVVWSYEGDSSNHFFSRSCGSNQRLPNGSTLITESDAGRAFEVTRDKTIVWEFLNPRRAGEKDELIAAVFEMVRLGPDFPLRWLD